MSELLVVGFQEKYKADEVMLNIIKKEQHHLVALEDAVVLTKNAQGKVRVKPYYDILSATQGHKSQFWGSIVSTLLESSDQEALSKIGLDQKICSDLRQMLQPNSSAILVLLKKIDLEQALAGIQEYQGKILYATLNLEGEQELLQTLN